MKAFISSVLTLCQCWLEYLSYSEIQSVTKQRQGVEITTSFTYVVSP